MRAFCINPYPDEGDATDMWLSSPGDAVRGRRLYVSLGDERIGLDEGKARHMREAINLYLAEQAAWAGSAAQAPSPGLVGHGTCDECGTCHACGENPPDCSVAVAITREERDRG